MKGDVFKGEKMIILSPKVLGKYTNHPLVKRLYLTDVGFFPNAQGHYRKRKTGIDEYILIYCTAGSGRIHLRDQQYTLQPHEAFCIPASQVHWYEALEENPWSILWVHFRGEDTQYFPVDNCKVVKFLSTTSTNHMIFLFELLFHALSGEYSIQKFIYTSQVLSLI